MAQLFKLLKRTEHSDKISDRRLDPSGIDRDLCGILTADCDF